MSRQDARRLIALKAGVLVERGVGWIGKLRIIGGFLVVRFARDGGPQIDHCAGVFVDHHDILIRVGFLLAAVMRPLDAGGVGPLAAALRTINRQRGRPFPGQGCGCDPTRVALRGEREIG